MITSQQLKILSAQGNLTLAEWWNALNSWKWIDALGPPEPIPDPWNPDTVRGAILKWIDSRLGEEFILRVCNVMIDKRMTDEQFTAWWAGRDRKYT